jgi:ankyrin repeat protein
MCLIAAFTVLGLQWRHDELDHRLIVAIKHRHNAEAILLLKLGASANARDVPYMPLSLGLIVSAVWTNLRRQEAAKGRYCPAIMLACTESHDGQRFITTADLSLLRELLKFGADPNASDNSTVRSECVAFTDTDHATTVLETQSEVGNTEVVRLLLKNGAKTDRPSALILAIGLGDVDTARVLIENGADVRARAKDGATLLHLAVTEYDQDAAMLDLLVNNGIDINSKATGVDMNGQNKAGWTPLMYAAGYGCFKNVPYLLRHGADPLARDTQGVTALELARTWGDSKQKRLAVRLLNEAETARSK